MRNIALITVLGLACAPAASAQSLLDTKAFLNVNGGGQTSSRTVSASFTQPIYGQTATATTTASVDGGPLFDLSVGYRFVPRIGVALGFSNFNKSGSLAGAASVPSPIFFNQPKAVIIPASSATHSERSIYVVLVGFVPITNRLDLAVSVGPSGIRVKQTLITGISIPAGTQDVIPTIEEQSGTAKGINAGADLSYMFLQRVGVGGFLRYNGGSVDLPAAPGLKVGGLQLGAGLRVRY